MYISNNINNTNNIDNLGFHIIVDYSNFSINNDNIFANFIYKTMKFVITNYSSMKIIHSYLHIFDPVIDKPGFTSVLLLDASHMSSHCYSNEGLLAVDLFTCGESDTKFIIEKFNEIILLQYPNIIINELYSLNRFKK